MAKEKGLWSGKEHFLKEEEKKKPGIKTVAVLVSAILILLVIYILIPGEKEEEEATQEELIDELSQYRNLSAEELLNLLNEERGFKEINPLREFEIRSGKYYFEPRRIEAQVNDLVVITILPAEVNYTLHIPKYFISRPVKAGAKVSVEFIPRNEGEFIFRAKEFATMEGRIVITK